MENSDIPTKVREFIGRYIGSIEQLEILLLLYRRRPAGLSAEEVSAELRTSVQSAGEKLAELHAWQLLSTLDDSPRHFRLAPNTNLESLVDALAKTYAERRFTIIDLIIANPLKNVQVFADAFRLRPDPSLEDDH